MKRRRAPVPGALLQHQRGQGHGTCAFQWSTARSAGTRATLKLKARQGRERRSALRCHCGSSQAEVPVTEPSEPGSIRALSVLVVDDEEAVREVAAAFLTHDGHHVQCVANGYEALRTLETPVDLVVTDRSMPGMRRTACPARKGDLGWHRRGAADRIWCLNGNCWWGRAKR